jgi:integrase
MRIDRAKRRANLTAPVVRRLEPPAVGYDLVYDEGERRLAIAVYASGAKVWKFLYSHRGRSRWFTIGKAGEDFTVIEARKRAKKLGGEVADGRDPQWEKMAKRDEASFGTLVARYLKQAETKKSYRQTEYLLNKHVLPKWRNRAVTDIKRANVIAIKEKLELDGTPDLARGVVAALSAVFTYGEAVDVVEANPCRGVKTKQPTEITRILSDAELPKFWGAFDAHGQVGRALKVLLLVGQRSGEVCRMRREHIIDGWWRMPGLPAKELGWNGTKNNRNHAVRLPEEVLELIGAAEGNNGRVFPSDITPRKLSVTMQVMCRVLKPSEPHPTPHDLRRTHGSTVTRMGFPEALMHRIQNHTPSRLSRIYNQHEYERESTRAMGAVAAKLLAIITGTDATDNVINLRG